MTTYEVTRTFPREEMFGLSSQLRRAALFDRREHCRRLGSILPIGVFLDRFFRSGILRFCFCSVSWARKLSDQSNCESNASDSLNRMPCVVWPRLAFGLGASNSLVFNLQPIASTRRSRITLMPGIGTPRIARAPSFRLAPKRSRCRINISFTKSFDPRITPSVICRTRSRNT